MTRQFQHQESTTTTSSATATIPWRSTKPSAVRQRRLLDRRRRGFKCLTIEYCPADVDGLVRSGFLDRQYRDDQAAIERAIVAMLERL